VYSSTSGCSRTSATHSFAKSRGVVTSGRCPFPGGRPCGDWKLVVSIPSSRAFWFISFTNPSRVPATCSAIASAASFADWIISAYSISSSGNVSPAARYTWLPPIPAASFDAVTGSSNDSRPSFTRSNTSIMSISLSMLAGYPTRSAPSSNSTRPSLASTTIAPM